VTNAKYFSKLMYNCSREDYTNENCYARADAEFQKFLASIWLCSQTVVQTCVHQSAGQP